jgi:D-3-phosphoglycerate dehydrogenase / 2-oxoglutarate reductase
MADSHVSSHLAGSVGWDAVETPSADRPTALITAPVRGAGIERLRAFADLVIDPWIDHRPLRLHSRDELAARLDKEGASIVVCEADEVAGPVLDLPLIAIGSTRGDPTNVDVAGATAAGIPVLHAPGRNADAVAELAVALLLAVSRHLLPADRDQRTAAVYRDGTIPYQRFRAAQVAGRTAGLVGLGAVGRATRWRLEGLGMRVIACDPYADDATHSLDDLLAAADVVSMHATVTPETTGMMDAERFARMKPDAIYLNTARAALHDLDALTAALADGHLAGAGLDHFAGESLAPDHPLAAMDNVVLTPHIGGATYDTEANHTTMICGDLVRLLTGKRPVHVINPEVFDR